MDLPSFLTMVVVVVLVLPFVLHQLGFWRWLAVRRVQYRQRHPKRRRTGKTRRSDAQYYDRRMVSMRTTLTPRGRR